MKFIVLGCGSIGTRHVRNLQLLGFSDIVVFDTNKDVLDQFKINHTVDIVYTLEEGISLKPDVALVCLPNHLHISVSIQLAHAGINLFIEKPLDLSLDRVDELVFLISKNHVIDMVACNFRFDTGLSTLNEMLKNGAIGKPLSLRTIFGQYLPDWRPHLDYRKNYAAKKETGGGIILDRIHEFDYVMWLMGTVQSIFGFSSRISDLEIETEDNADVVFQHTNGVVSNIHIDYLRREYLCTCEVTGTNGILFWDFKKRHLKVFYADGKIWKDLSSTLSSDINDMYIKELKYYTDCVFRKSKTFNSVQDASNVLKTVLQVKENVLKL